MTEHSDDTLADESETHEDSDELDEALGDEDEFDGVLEGDSGTEAEPAGESVEP
jgi:hypothetical protein